MASEATPQWTQGLLMNPVSFRTESKIITNRMGCDRDALPIVQNNVNVIPHKFEIEPHKVQGHFA